MVKLKKDYIKENDELKSEIQALKIEKAKFQERVNDAILRICKDACDEAEDYINDFYKYMGMEVPVKTVLIEVEVGIFDDLEDLGVFNIYTDEKFNEVKAKLKSIN